MAPTDYIKPGMSAEALHYIVKELFM
jgi:hypothetical protein